MQIQKLLDMMKQLRDPETGCPWDIEQDFKSIARYTIEEAYEVVDAIENGSTDDLKEELGDLLLQVVFHSQIADDKGMFNFDDVINTITGKMIRRHPHVFGDDDAKNTEDVGKIWAEQKAKEKTKPTNQTNSLMENIPLALPALKRAKKIQKQSAIAGFEWDRPIDVLDKVEEEIKELREAIENEGEKEIREEFGDLLFVLSNFGRRINVDCEDALREANTKFIRRFQGMEKAAENKQLSFIDLDLKEQENLWNAEKQKEIQA